MYCTAISASAITKTECTSPYIRNISIQIQPCTFLYNMHLMQRMLHL